MIEKMQDTYRVEQDRLGELTCFLFGCGVGCDSAFDEFPEGVLGCGGVVSLDEVECARAVTEIQYIR